MCEYKYICVCVYVSLHVYIYMSYTPIILPESKKKKVQLILFIHSSFVL